MEKIQIKSVYGKTLFEYEKDDNSVRDTVEEAVKQGVSLCKADLRGASLYGANLREADLRGAYLYGANLCEANLCGANLRGAYLRGADLCEANLCGANLHGAVLYGAELSGTNNTPNIPMSCPSEGSFIAWKKVGKKLIKLEIPEDARRSSATSTKCRCDKAKVLSITDLDGDNPIDEIDNYSYYTVLTYRVGQMVYPDSFDENRWNECSNGIHFFVDKQEAIDY